MADKLSIRALRVNKGLTQAEVSKKLGVSTTTYSAWEKDISKVGVGKVKQIADFYGVSIDDIRLKS